VTSPRWALVHLACGLLRPLQGMATILGAAAGGALRRAELRDSIAGIWTAVAQMEDDDLPGLHAWEADFYAQHLDGARRVLLVACGTGRDLVPLLERGHEVVGLDLSLPALDGARQRLARRGLTAELIAGAVEDTALPAGFDAVVFSWLCYAYVPESQTRVRALRALGACLGPGGRLLISYPLRPARTNPWPARAARLAAVLTRSDWRPAAGDLFVAARRGAQTELHYEHHFTSDEFLAEARAAGLEPVFHDARGLGRAVLTPGPRG